MPAPARRRLLTDVAILVVLLALVAVGTLRWIDTTAYPVVVLQTAAPFVAIGLLLLAVATAVLRRWWMLLPVGLAVVVAATLVAPAFFSHASPEATRDLTVMSSNLRLGRAQPTQLMDAVRFHAVDVLVLTEVTTAALEGLTEEGADSYFPQQIGEPEVDGHAGTMVLSRYPLREVEADLGGSPNRQPEVAVTVDGVDLRVQAAHPAAPTAGQTRQWRSGLLTLQAWKERQTASAPLLLVGDFNSSSAHPGFRALADGLDDAQRTTGSGWVRTWPYAGSRFPPFVQLDHVLSRGLTVIDSGQVALNGTDHAAVWGSYALAAASATGSG
jgi:endonuclease/exonuclease/phosphatase (EEP) superfamily protein YafD